MFLMLQQNNYQQAPFNTDFILEGLDRRKQRCAHKQHPNTMEPYTWGPQEGLWPGAELTQGSGCGTTAVVWKHLFFHQLKPR